MKNPILFLVAIIAVITSSCNNPTAKAPASEIVIKQEPLPKENFLQIKKQETYIAVSNAVGYMLAHEKRDTVLKKNYENFKKLYYGKALLLEDSSVNMAMRHFSGCTGDYLDHDMFTTVTDWKSAGMGLIDSMRKYITVNNNK